MVIVTALLLASWFGGKYFALFDARLAPGAVRNLFFGTPVSPADVLYEVEEVVSGLLVPWSIVWTSPDRMLIAERPGRLRVFVGGKLLDRPLVTFHDVSRGGEEGLMGVAVDPEYSANGYL